MEHYFLINYQVMVNGQVEIICGLTGSVSNNPNDYKPNTVKREIEDRCRKKFPRTIISVVFMPPVRKVEKGIYDTADFTDLG